MSLLLVANSNMASFFSLAFFALLLIAQNQISQGYSFSPHDNHPEPCEIAKMIYNTTFVKHPSNETQQSSDFITREINSTLLLNKGIFEMIKEISSDHKKNGKLMQLNYELEAIEEAVRNVEDSYDQLSTYAEFLLSHDKRSFAIEKFASLTIDESDCSLRRYLKTASSMIIRDRFTNGDEAVQNIMLETLYEYRSLCNRNKSLSMMMVELYDIIIKTEIKWMVIMNFAYDVLEKYNTGQYDYRLDLGLLESETKIRTDKVKEHIRDAVLQASRTVWSCDPPDSINSRASLGEEISSKRNVYFNLELVKTDLSDSQWMIMTGARFNRRVTVIEGETAEEIYLEIQQGILMSDGSIDVSTLSWKNSLNKKEPKRYRLHVNRTSIRLTTQDPFYMTVFLTGLQLFIGNDSFINLQAFHSTDPRESSKFFHGQFYHYILPLQQKVLDDDQELSDLVSNAENFETFTFLTRSRSYIGVYDPYINKTSDEIARYKLDQSHMSASDKSQCKHQQSKTVTRYFKHVVFEEFPEDGEESRSVVVPFVDLQEVVTNPPVPLTGVGIYHKGTRGCKSYVALELLTQVLEPRFYKT